jgi:hypothetical protein
MRFVMVSVHTKLETSSEVFSHRVITDRFRIRTFGLPYPPVHGHYDLRADWRTEGSEDWSREGVAWPLVIAENAPKPRLIN